jgi:hypothetical protein
MKIIAAIVLVFFASCGQSVIIDCEFIMANWEAVGAVYNCWSGSQASENSRVIQEVRGEHAPGLTNLDVKLFFEFGNELQYIPSNIAVVFPNLIAMFIDSPLLELSASDLQPFPNLVRFQSMAGLFQVVDGDLFQHNPRLRWINLYGGWLEHVGENLLSGLSELIQADFRDNECINFLADTPETIQELQQLLLVQCPPFDESISTTPRIPTTPRSECTVRCTLENEFQERNSVQNVVTTELLGTIASQEQRILTLERMMINLASELDVQ